ncbi:hypothetical protein ACVIGB_010103 [Bradyrhizobium sp. USDA 4341]
MNSSDTSPSFKIRSTVPGGRRGLKEWSHDELSSLVASYRSNYPTEWVVYLESENERGFITNSMNDHIVTHLRSSVPRLSAPHYRAGAVDFRFFNEHDFGFRLWRPEQRAVRTENYLAYLKDAHAHHQSIYANGDVEWTAKQIDSFLIFLEQSASEFWTQVCADYNEFGFVDGASVMAEFRRLAAAVFPIPEDLESSTIGGAVIDEANRVRPFEMLKPENRESRVRLRTSWMAEKSSMPFAEWRTHAREKLRNQEH